MTFQTKLSLQLLTIAFALVTTFAVSLIGYTKTALEKIEAQQEQAQITQVKQQFARFGDEVVRRVEAIANRETTVRMALDLALPKVDKTLYVNDAIGAARDQNLDSLEVTSWDGTVISSTLGDSRLGSDNSASVKTDWSNSSAFLEKQQFRDVLLLSAVRSIGVEGKRLYIQGGCRVENFLSSVVLPSHMRVFLYRNFTGSTFKPTELLDRNGVVGQAQTFAPIIQQAMRHKEALPETTLLTDEATSPEAFYAMPLSGPNNNLLGILLVGSSRREQVLLMRRTEWFAVGFAVAASAIALPICFWFLSRVSSLSAR